MNKPILAAVTGVGFGLFLGGLYFSHPSYRGAAPQIVSNIPVTLVVVQDLPRPPCAQRMHGPPAAPVDPISDAQTAYVNQDFALAIRLAQSSPQPTSVRAWRVIGGAACRQQDLKLSDTAYRHLDAAGRQYMIYTCQRSGVSKTGRHFALNAAE